MTITPEDIAALPALRRRMEANADAFKEDADGIEALCDWLGEVWDHFPDECEDYQREECERVNHALQQALIPWKGEIIAFVRKQREQHAAKGFASRRGLVLFGVTLPAVRS